MTIEGEFNFVWKTGYGFSFLIRNPIANGTSGFGSVGWFSIKGDGKRIVVFNFDCEATVRLNDEVPNVHIFSQAE